MKHFRNKGSAKLSVIAIFIRRILAFEEFKFSSTLMIFRLPCKVITHLSNYFLYPELVEGLLVLYQLQLFIASPVASQSVHRSVILFDNRIDKVQWHIFNRHCKRAVFQFLIVRK